MLTPLCSSKDFTAAMEAFEAIENREASVLLRSTLLRRVKNKVFSPARNAGKMKDNG